MNLTNSKNPDSMVLGSAKIEISKSPIEIDNAKKKWKIIDLEDLGLARGVKIGTSSSKINVEADNGDVPLKGETNRKKSVELSILERHLPLLGKVMGGIVDVNAEIEGVKKCVDKKEKNTIVSDELILFSQNNFDLSEPENIVIKNGIKTLAKTTDFTVVATDKGFWGFKIKSTSTNFDADKPTVIEYEIGKVVAYTMSEGSGGLATPLSMKLTNKRQATNGKIISREYNFAYGFYTGEDSISFKSKNDADQVLEVPLKFEFTPHPDLIDDDFFAKSNLMFERAEEA